MNAPQASKVPSLPCVPIWLMRNLSQVVNNGLLKIKIEDVILESVEKWHITKQDVFNAFSLLKVNNLER